VGGRLSSKVASRGGDETAKEVSTMESARASQRLHAQFTDV
jgi:hypothetical protein